MNNPSTVDNDWEVISELIAETYSDSSIHKGPIEWILGCLNDGLEKTEVEKRIQERRSYCLHATQGFPLKRRFRHYPPWLRAQSWGRKALNCLVCQRMDSGSPWRPIEQATIRGSAEKPSNLLTVPANHSRNHSRRGVSDRSISKYPEPRKHG